MAGRRSAPLEGRCRAKKGQLLEGLRYVRDRHDLLLPMALIFVVATFGLNFQVHHCADGQGRVSHRGGVLRLLSTMIAVGSLGGALLSSRRKGRPRIRLLLGSAFAFGVPGNVGRPDADLRDVWHSPHPTGVASLMFTTSG